MYHKPYFRYCKTHLYLFFSIFGATYNQNLEDFYLIDKCFRGVFYSSASSIQKRLKIAKILYLTEELCIARGHRLSTLCSLRD